MNFLILIPIFILLICVIISIILAVLLLNKGSSSSSSTSPKTSPKTLAPTTLAPTLAPTTLAPTTLEPTTLAPTTLEPTTAYLGSTIQMKASYTGTTIAPYLTNSTGPLCQAACNINPLCKVGYYNSNNDVCSLYGTGATTKAYATGDLSYIKE